MVAHIRPTKIKLLVNLKTVAFKFKKGDILERAIHVPSGKDVYTDPTRLIRLIPNNAMISPSIACSVLKDWQYEVLEVE